MTMTATSSVPPVLAAAMACRVIPVLTIDQPEHGAGVAGGHSPAANGGFRQIRNPDPKGVTHGTKGTGEPPEEGTP
jgi:hypothetical protein